MRDDKQDQFMDDLLEASLKRHGGEEPRAGLEMRILAGIRSRERAARRRGLAWAGAACAGVLAGVILALHFARAPSRQPAPSASLPRPTTKPLASSASADSRLWSPRLARGPKQKLRAPRPEGQVARLARPQQFPSPMPLTQQEKLLLAYFDKATEPDFVVGTNQANEAAASDLEIPGIKIADLEIKPLVESESEQEH